MKALYTVVLLAATSCKSDASPAREPTWTATAPLESDYPIRNATCGADGKTVLIDVPPGMINVFPASKSILVGVPSGPRLEHSDSPLVLDGSDVVDAERGSGASVPGELAVRHSTWSESRDGHTFARALFSEDGGTHIDVFGRVHWSAVVPDDVAGLRLSNDGLVLAVVLRPPHSGKESLQLLGSGGVPVGGPIALGDDATGVLAFDETGNRVATISSTSPGHAVLVVSTKTGAELQEVPLREGIGAMSRGLEPDDVWMGFHGDEVWGFTSRWRGGGEGIGTVSACMYTRVSLRNKSIVTQDNLPKVFGPEPTRNCDVRVICPVDSGGVLLLRHDFKTLTVESRSAPP